MMYSSMVVIVGMLAVVVGQQTAQAAEVEVPSPEYGSWAHYEPGTYIEHRTISTSGRNKSVSITRYTLKQKTDAKVVVEMAVTMDASGQKIEQPVRTRDIPATSKIDESARGEPMRPRQTKASGKQAMTVAGRRFDTTWYEIVIDAGDFKSETKQWMSDRVPGMIAKMVTTNSGKNGRSTAVLEVSRMELKVKQKE